MPLRRLLAAALAALAFAPPAADAALRTVAIAPSPAVAAGGGLVAWRAGAAVEALEPKSGRRFVAAAPERCEFAALGGRHVLWTCSGSASTAPDWYPDAVAVDLRTLVRRTVDGQGMGRSIGYSIVWRAIGRHWVEFEYDAYHVEDHSGWRRLADGAMRYPQCCAAARDHVEDLDREALQVRLCRPLLRRVVRPAEDFGRPAVFAHVEYERPFGVDTSRTSLRVQRCGSRRSVRVSACRGGCADAALHAGWLTWRERRTVHAYRPATGRRLHWVVAPGSRLARSGRRLVVSQPVGTNWTVGVAVLPGRGAARA